MPDSRCRKADGCARAHSQPNNHDDKSALQWLAQRKDRSGKTLLEHDEVDAGERLRRDFHIAQMSPRMTMNWSRFLTGNVGRPGSPDHGADVQDAVSAAKERVRDALRAVGPELSGVLIDICCFEKGLEASEKAIGLPRRAGKIVLKIALRQLGRHYGILRDHDRDALASRTPIRHWGSSDYRPSVDGGEAI